AEPGVSPSPASPSAVTNAEPAPEPTATPAPTPDPAVALIATAAGPSVEVFAAPGDAAPALTVAAADVVSLPDAIPLTFLAIERDGDWLHVHLPVRPNGSTGWVRAADVTLSSTDYRVEVRLTEHRLLLHRGDEVVMDVPVGLGAADVPTPGGVYYVKELLQPPTPGGVYGAYAYGLSGYSPVLTSFAGGQGVIGIHGTNQPESVGTDASHGCIRMLDADVTRLVEEFGLPLGTPVEIVA
ncbi:L,D-transpeptidase, partial [Actinotalea ferrariae]|uniref:L,D-transpeptidase n=1 Tax=Actinotalea ferrariae TaxID=1386098 RepID=UPI001C8C5449